MHKIRHQSYTGKYLEKKQPITVAQVFPQFPAKSFIQSICVKTHAFSEVKKLFSTLDVESMKLTVVVNFLNVLSVSKIIVILKKKDFNFHLNFIIVKFQPKDQK
jgi:hypothetical protein